MYSRIIILKVDIFQCQGRISLFLFLEFIEFKFIKIPHEFYNAIVLSPWIYLIRSMVSTQM